MNSSYAWHQKELERQFKALANKRRLSILAYLKNKKEKEATVGDIAQAIRLSFKSTSRHLGVLSAANILEKEQRSLEVHYFLAPRMSNVARHSVSLL